jgi:hypothetical protein
MKWQWRIQWNWFHWNHCSYIGGIFGRKLLFLVDIPFVGEMGISPNIVTNSKGGVPCKLFNWNHFCWVGWRLQLVCFYWYKSLFSVRFKSGWGLSRIESWHSMKLAWERSFFCIGWILGHGSFSEYESLYSITFESGLTLSRIEKEAFFTIGLIEIILPSSVEVLDDDCFQLCESVCSLTFETG